MEPTATRPVARTDVHVTRLSLGTAPLGNLFTPVTESNARDTVDAAWDAGIRYYDTAPFYGYGLAEQRLGAALRDRPRAEYSLSTKVGRRLVPAGHRERSEGYVRPLPFEPVFDYGYDGVLRSFEESLLRLGVERVDIAYLHDLGRVTHGEDGHRRTFRDAMDGGVRALEELKRDGRVGAIGLGVNEWEVCVEAMAHASFDAFLLAGRYTLLDQGALDVFLPASQERGISVVLGGPFNSGILAAPAPAPDDSGDVESVGATYDYVAPTGEVVSRVRALRAICGRHGVPLAAAALRFPTLHPAITTVLAGARTAAEVRANVALARFDVPAALFDELKRAGLLRADAPTEPHP